MARILIMDDEGTARHSLRYSLQREGFEVVCTDETQQIPLLIEQLQTELIILDVTAAQMGGWQIARQLRQDADLPMLLIGPGGDYTDAVKGFQLGADDYMAKPFHPEELVMRVRSLLKRNRVAACTKIHIGEFMIDRTMHEVQVQGQSLFLPLKEFQLLFTLASYPNHILTRSQLIEQVWGVNYEGGERTVDVHIKRLRSKLASFSQAIQFTTVRGLGYRFEIKTTRH
ncbi:response regulator transcription factor [Paenibacillus sp. HWE-109]|uniref:response regulator transcription factor n=1 Tax=Paenibacillus sp. HWE-109 TaxID=1306526 RepID=UPI001EE15398|nr:response regulator transcription factor [Paenibacillus sp. HWE-109]UKS26436.1 response regulator transcription factor [Paenibacillus sp. HWE-109]